MHIQTKPKLVNIALLKNTFMRFYLFIFAIQLGSFGYVWGQGCSSAGFCTMGALKADQKFSLSKKIKLNYIEINQLVAFSGLGETINATTLDAAVSVGTKNQLQWRVPYAWVNGPLASTKSLGDVYLTYTRNLIATPHYSINASVGTKFPRFTTALATPEGLPLPMYYSPSLGTYDIILGLSFNNKNWLVGGGYQQALGNNIIDNQFIASDWENTPLANQATRYTNSKNLRRGADAMLRLQRKFHIGRLGFSAGLMPVYRLTPDEIEQEDGERIKLANSKALVITGILTGSYNLNAHSAFKILYGKTLLARESNADGLMKTSVTTIAYEWRF